MNRPKKIKNCIFFAKRPLKLDKIWSMTFSMIFKKSFLEGICEFLHPDPNLTKIFYPQEICAENFWLPIYIGIHIIIYIPKKYKENWRTLLIFRPTPPHTIPPHPETQRKAPRSVNCAGPRWQSVPARSTLLPHTLYKRDPFINERKKQIKF